MKIFLEILETILPETSSASRHSIGKKRRNLKQRSLLLEILTKLQEAETKLVGSHMRLSYGKNMARTPYEKTEKTIREKTKTALKLKAANVFIEFKFSLATMQIKANF